MSRRAHNGTTMFGERKRRIEEGGRGREGTIGTGDEGRSATLHDSNTKQSRGKEAGAGDTVWLCVSAL